ncbi:MAG: GAF domain-containing protein, partial [Chloroflexi bacterium]|nr:GAF domain-containing protein [Chloroflexota bacterium]
MSDSSGNIQVVTDEPTQVPCAVIWLGESSPLLQAAWSRVDVHHVRTEKVLLRALHVRLASCVVVDTRLPDLDLPDLLASIRRTWPAVGIVALFDTVPDGKPHSEIDRYLGVNTPVEDLVGHLRQLVLHVGEQRADGTAAADTAAAESRYAALQTRMRHLEGLVQATFALSGAVTTAEIVGDLREVARVAVDADDMAVLLTDDGFTDLVDLLNLGVPDAYLQVCREHLLALPPNERELYLGDEVLLRERLPDMLPSAQRIREAEAAGAWSYMRLPLTVDRKLVGVVSLFSESPGRFDGAHLQLARLFATQVATAVRNVRLYVRLNQAEQRQRTVSQVARLIAENLALDVVLNRIVEEAVRLIDGKAGLVMLLQPDRSLHVSAVHGEQELQNRIGYRLEPGIGQAGRVAQSGETSVVTNYPAWEGANEDFRHSMSPDTVLFGVPLTYRGEVLGVLQVTSTHNQPQRITADQEVLNILAPQAATAIAKAQLHETVRQDWQQLQAILDHTAAAVAMCDAEGRVLMINSEAQRILARLGIALQTYAGQPLGEVLVELLPDQALKLSELGDIIEIGLGEVGEFLLKIARINKPDGTVERYVGVAQDVTELRRLDRMKSDMIHILSHDLRNPLGLARGSIDLLDEPDVPPDQREQLKNMIISSLDRMEQLIRDVVDLEMAGTLGKDTAVPYRLPTLVQKVVQRYRAKADSQKLTLTYTEDRLPDRRLRGHAVMIGQAIDNLVSNALKYTPEGGRVDVSLTTEGE